MVSKLFCCALYAAAALPLSAQALSVTAPPLPVRHGVIIARIESDKAVYRVGEPIKLRLTLINRSARTVFFFPGAPYAITNLTVFNSREKRASSVGAQSEACPFGCGGQPYTLKLDPGKPVIVEYNDRQSHWALRQWADIRRWGYDLRQAGEYFLIVSPKVTALAIGVPEFTTSSADKSNTIHITVIK